MCWVVSVDSFRRVEPLSTDGAGFASACVSAMVPY